MTLTLLHEQKHHVQHRHKKQQEQQNSKTEQEEAHPQHKQKVQHKHINNNNHYNNTHKKKGDTSETRDGDAPTSSLIVIIIMAGVIRPVMTLILLDSSLPPIMQGSERRNVPILKLIIRSTVLVSLLAGLLTLALPGRCVHRS